MLAPLAGIRHLVLVGMLVLVGTLALVVALVQVPAQECVVLVLLEPPGSLWNEQRENYDESNQSLYLFGEREEIGSS